LGAAVFIHSESEYPDPTAGSSRIAIDSLHWDGGIGRVNPVGGDGGGGPFEALGIQEGTETILTARYDGRPVPSSSYAAFLDECSYRVQWDEVRIGITGDVDDSGKFDSGDLVEMFIGGEYEDEEEDNSDPKEGDMKADADFNSADLVLAMQRGHYDQDVVIPDVSEPVWGYGVLLVVMLLLARWVNPRRLEPSMSQSR
jgi:hypothetical protein